ncbi:MAG: methyltransferase domain-containing protein [Methanobacteriota archaeon]|nr:MAG: methyltransferase domain-containing protein [Euryarchaeota archaeon]
MKCRVCNKELFIRSDEKRLLICENCNARYRLNVIKNDVGFFKNDYISRENYWLFEDVRKVALQKINKIILKYRPTPKQWLDVGSATGYIYQICSLPAETKVSIEVSSNGAKRIQKMYPDVRVINSDIDSASLEGYSFDLCTVLDTIYFHPEPKKFMHKIYTYMQKGGILICEVPNYQWLHLVGRTEEGGTHWKIYYCRKTIVELLSKVGFDYLETYDNIGNVPHGIKKIINYSAYYFGRSIRKITLGKIDFVPKIIVVAKK